MDALLHAQQDRRRHDLPLGAVSVGADAAGDGRRLSKTPPPADDLDRVLEGGEDVDQLLADVLDRRNDGHRNAGSEQSVFDRRRAGLVFHETPHLVQHGVPLSVLFAAEARSNNRSGMVNKSKPRLTMNDQKVTMRAQMPR